MKELTLVCFKRPGEILLAMKKRGFGAGKWNGYGGKLQTGETLTQAAVREVKEESGVSITENSLTHLGILDFYFTDKAEWNQRVHIYTITNWHGEPEETEEMNPKWFSFDAIPYSEMWAGDEEWFPYMLRDEPFVGEIYFKDEGKKVVSVTVREK